MGEGKALMLLSRGKREGCGEGSFWLFRFWRLATLILVFEAVGFA